MRSLHKAWQSERPMIKTTRRVRWYQSSTSIRLKFDDQYGEVNKFFTMDDKDKATRLYEAFIAGRFTVPELQSNKEQELYD